MNIVQNQYHSLRIPGCFELYIVKNFHKKSKVEDLVIEKKVLYIIS